MTTKIKTIIIKPRSRELQLNQKALIKIHKERRLFHKYKSVYKDYLEDTYYTLNDACKSDFDKSKIFEFL